MAAQKLVRAHLSFFIVSNCEGLALVDIRVKDLPLGTPNASKLLAMDLTTTERATIKDIVYAGRPAASQADAEAGTDADKAMTALATKQAIAFQAILQSQAGSVGLDVLSSASQAEAIAAVGVDTSDFIAQDANGNIDVPGYSTVRAGEAVLSETYGGGQSAVGQVTTINGLQFGVPNVQADPSILSTYASRDAVAHFTFMQGNQNVLAVPGSGTTYGTGYVENSVIVAGDNCKPGQIIDTAHTPKWSGVITSVDNTLHRANVSAWYRVDGTGTTGTPAAGVGCTINITTKLFGQNTAVWFGQGVSSDIDGHGYELDMVWQKAGLGVYYGFDAVAYGAFQPSTNYAHSARWGGGVARWLGGFYSEDSLSGGAFSSYWRAGTDFTQPLLRSRVGTDNPLFLMDAAGKTSATRQTTVTTATAITVSSTSGSVIICTNASGSIAITLPSAATTGINNGRKIRVVTLGAGGATVVKPGGAVIATLATGRFQEVIASGNDWQPIGAGGVV